MSKKSDFDNPIDIALRKIIEKESRDSDQEIEKQVDIVLKAKQIFTTELDRLKSIVAYNKAKDEEFSELVKDFREIISSKI